jgi:hypothetical protein
MSTSDAGRKPRTPRSRIRPPLTTSLLREDQAPLGVLLREHERVDLVAEVDLVRGVDRAADRELGNRDHPLRLVADVDQDLVLVDPHDLAGDDVALVDRLDRRRVVGDELAVDLDQEVVGTLRGRGGGRRVGRRRGVCRWHVGRRHGAEV